MNIRRLSKDEWDQLERELNERVRNAVPYSPPDVEPAEPVEAPMGWGGVAMFGLAFLAAIAFAIWWRMG